MKGKEIFTAEATAGWEGVDSFGYDKPPPHTAKFVAEASWSWSPAHSRYSKYWMCTDRQRKGWYLYEQGFHFETDEKVFVCVAAGNPYKKNNAKLAAGQLLLKALKKEIETVSEDLEPPHQVLPGLLNEKDVLTIFAQIGELIEADAIAKEEEETRRRAPYLEDIERIAGNFSDTPIRGRIGGRPSDRYIVRRWLEEFVGETGNLPKGRHHVTSNNGTLGEIDFDDY